MSLENVESFNANIHAGTAPAFNGTHVVNGEIALTDITFVDPIHDELDQHVGPRDARWCPEIATLTAFSTSPCVQEAERRQYLRVPCPANRGVIGLGGGTYHSVCGVRMAAAGLKPENITEEWLTDPDKRCQIRCPFSYLRGAVEGPDMRLGVAVGAESSLPYLRVTE